MTGITAVCSVAARPAGDPAVPSRGLHRRKKMQHCGEEFRN